MAATPGQVPALTGSGEIKKEGGAGQRGSGARQAGPSVPSSAAPTTTELMNQPPVIETSTPGAPKAADRALRGRATKFYQSYVEGKFRQADFYVAEDSKDAFFAMDKPRYLKVWGHKIQYSPDYKKAQVLTTVDFEMKAARIGTMVVRPQIPSTWKLQKGQWFWYKGPDTDIPTPWGTSKVSSESGGLQMNRVTVNDVLGSVVLDKTKVMLLGYQNSSATLKVTNKMPGEVRIAVEGITAPNLTVRSGKTKLAGGETAEITFDYKPVDQSAKPTLAGWVRVSPVETQLPFEVVFDIPEEIKQKLPKLQ